MRLLTGDLGIILGFRVRRLPNWGEGAYIPLYQHQHKVSHKIKIIKRILLGKSS